MKIDEMKRMNFSLTDEVVAIVRAEVVVAVRHGHDSCSVQLPYAISELTFNRVQERLGDGFITPMRTGGDTMLLRVNLK